MTVKGETPKWFGFSKDVREIEPEGYSHLKGHRPQAATYVTMIVDTPDKVRTGIHHVFAGGRTTGVYEREQINEARLVGPLTIWDRLRGRGRERIIWEETPVTSLVPQRQEVSSK
mgnify:CR=1 FL=1